MTGFQWMRLFYSVNCITRKEQKFSLTTTETRFCRIGLLPFRMSTSTGEGTVTEVRWEIATVCLVLRHLLEIELFVVFPFLTSYCISEQKELDTAIDEGGPTREFLSQFFYQLGDVSIEVEGEDDEPVRLFEKANNGIVPLTDELLDSKFGGSPELKEKARAYYRAFGRVMLHALATGNTISSSAMPPFYQNCKCFESQWCPAKSSV